VTSEPQQSNESSSDVRRILIVDDNDATLDLLSALFLEEGLDTVKACNVAEARRLLIESAGDFDLVLSDIQMPGETGFDLLKWIKGAESPRPDLPVLLTTAQLPEAENRVLGLSLGAVDYVVRPIELRELVLRVMHAMEHFQRVRSLQRSLENAETLAMTGRLMAASNHEVKNLVGIVSMAADQLRRQIAPMLAERPPQDNMRRTLDALTKSSKLLADVTRSAAHLMRPDGSDSTTLNLGEVAAEVVDMMQARIRPIRLLLEPTANPAYAWGRDVAVRQILVNFILNAADAIEEMSPVEGGCIRIQVRDSTAATCCIEVADNGVGLSEAGVRLNFAAFASTKTLRGGQGLGLWLCSRLAEQMKGSISLQSKGPGRGAVATLTLNRSPQPAPSESFDLSQYFVH
jgi:signal transduction histidine kinase